MTRIESLVACMLASLVVALLALCAGDVAVAQPQRARWVLANYAMPLSLTTVNLGAWNALDAATQKAVRQAAAETEARQWQALDGRLAKNYERMHENGMTITREVSPALAAKFKTAAQAAIAEWEAKSGAEGREILERFRTK